MQLLVIQRLQIKRDLTVSLPSLKVPFRSTPIPIARKKCFPGFALNKRLIDKLLFIIR